jgi:tetratricopeptide (TPR) repeat protein
VLLEEAAALARQLGDRARECDVLGNLGLATLAVGQASLARQLFESELAMAREAGDRFAEKVALNNLGLADSSLGDPVQAITAFEGALALAHAVGDRHHEAELLWYLAIQHAGLGRRGPAIARARAAVDLFERMGRPEAAWFADHLRRYQGGDPTNRLGGAGTVEVPGQSFGGSIDAGAMAPQAGPSTMPGPAEPGPGLLLMALSATKAMAKFLGSGMKTATPELRQERLGTCAACEHHTGLRCRICGCFTEAKARMLHEECPLGKWPVTIDPRSLRSPSGTTRPDTSADVRD